MMFEKPVLLRLLDRLGAFATLLLPLFLVHWRGIAEGCLDGLAVGFLLRSALTRDWSWCRQGFVWPALVWWGWLVLCSLSRQMPVPAEATASLTQALLAIRFPLAAFALAFWTLQNPWTLWRRVRTGRIPLSFISRPTRRSPTSSPASLSSMVIRGRP